MRLSLFAAVAAAPLLLVLPQQAAAATTISNASTTAVATSTADGSGGPSDVIIGSGASVKPAGGSAITIDSSNTVENDGTVEIDAYDGAIGVVTRGPVTSALNNTGSIVIGDGYTATDSVNGDGVIEAPLAKGTGRYGVEVLGPFTGSITNSGTITVRGNNSYGIGVDAPLFGNILSTGSISLTGDNGAAIRNTAPISGGIQLASPITAAGQNTNAVDIAAPVGGAISIYSTVSATGYSATTRNTSVTALDKIQATPTDVEQGGSALKIESNVGGGIFLGAPPAGTTAGATTDVDADGIADGVEGAGLVDSYGSAPAISFGGPAALTVGNFGVGGNAFGLIVRGAVLADGVYDGINATGVDVGVGGAGVDLTGGARIYGSVTANAHLANATGFALEGGAKAQQLEIDGLLTGTVTSSGASLATGLRLEPGASLPTLVNYGALSAVMNGDAGSATAVVDRSGTINFIENTGTISASIVPVAAGDVISGTTTALDLRANTTGVFLHQELNGTVAPVIHGDVFLGSGANTVQLLAGTMTGALDLGSGSGSSVLIAGGAAYTGALTSEGSGLAINVASGSLIDTSATPLSLSSLTVGSTGALSLALDPAHSTSSLLTVSGTANLAPGSSLAVTLASAPTGAQSYTLIKAGTLVAPASQSVLTINAPYLFSATGAVDTSAGSVTVDIRRRTAQEMGLNKSESGALNATYDALGQDSALQSILFGAQTRGEFISAYSQMLPDHAGDVFRVASDVPSQIGRAISQTKLLDADSGTLVWLQEIGSALDQSKGDGEGYRAYTGGLVGGLALTGGRQQLGITLAGVDSEIKPNDRPSTDQVSVTNVDAGLYWRVGVGGFVADARVGAGYISVKSNRVFSGTLNAASVTRIATGTWNGYDLNARVDISYPITLGRAYLRPELSAELFNLHESGYSEAGGGYGFDLDVQNRTTNASKATASLTAGWNIGDEFIWRPEIEVARSDVVQFSGGVTTARYAYGGDSFTTVANDLTGSSNIARLRLTGTGKSMQMAFEAGGEFQDGSTQTEARASVQFPF